jgi:SAM-dependent methyltransferase
MDQHAWDDRYRDKELVWTAPPNRFLVEAVDGLTPGTALDLAAGEGRNAVWLAEQGWKVDAVDWSDVALDKGRELARRAGVSVWFTQEDLRSWWPSASVYDLVVIAYLQIPDTERHGSWRGAAQAVAPGGRLIVIGHDSENLTRGYGGPQRPEVLYGTDEVVSIVGEHLEVVRAEQVIRPVEDDGTVHQAIDNIVVAVRP